MILPSDIQVLVATKPVDFRKQMDGLAALVAQTHSADPYCGAVYCASRDRAVPRQVDSGAAKRLPPTVESADVDAMSTEPSALPPELPGDLEAALALLAAERAAHATAPEPARRRHTGFSGVRGQALTCVRYQMPSYIATQTADVMGQLLPSRVPLTRATALTLMLALTTGERIGEVTGMAMIELDLNGTAPVWTVPGERAKNGQANRVPLSPLALDLIEQARTLAPNSSWLFPGGRGAGPIDPLAPTKALERARPVIGLDDFRIHDLRRTAATRMAEMGIAPHTIALVLNHVSARQGTVTGKVYVQYSYDREKREALGAWGSRLERILVLDLPRFRGAV